jgi:membrane protein DedA with SNARE-associated domain/membrane-associated phospholipid phosphatase
MSLTDKILDLPFPVLNHWGYWIIFLASLLEASPVLGLFIPAQTIVMAGGFLAKLKIMKLENVILISIIGAVIGDNFGYFLGWKYGESLIQKLKKYRFFKAEYYEKTKELMQKHAGKALFLGRFNSFTRAFGPIIAAATNISLPRFLLYDTLSCVFWAAGMVGAGYVFGTSYELGAKYMGKLIFSAVAISAVIVLAYKYVNRKRHIFSRFHFYVLAMNILTVILFFRLADDILDKEYFFTLDQKVSGMMHLLRSPWLNKTMIFVSHATEPLIMIVLSVVLVAFFLYDKKHQSFLLLLSMGGAILSENIVKGVMMRPRPLNALAAFSGYSFPSGHATAAIIFFLFLFYTYKNSFSNRVFRTLFLLAMPLLILLVGFNRVYLNAHYISDVIAGFALGLFWITLLILVFKIITSLKGLRNGLGENIPGPSLKQ